jgi:hypothetical protein
MWHWSYGRCRTEARSDCGKGLGGVPLVEASGEREIGDEIDCEPSGVYPDV